MNLIFVELGGPVVGGNCVVSLVIGWWWCVNIQRAAHDVWVHKKKAQMLFIFLNLKTLTREFSSGCIFLHVVAATQHKTKFVWFTVVVVAFFIPDCFGTQFT